MNDTSFFVTDATKPRFTDVDHWDKDKKALVVNPNRPDRPGFDDPNRLESGGGGSSPRRTTMRASPRCSSARARSPATRC